MGHHALKAGYRFSVYRTLVRGSAYLQNPIATGH